MKLDAATIITRDFEQLTYRRMIANGFAPDGLIDVGAYEGNWTITARQLFGPLPTLMVEAQPGKTERLETITKTHPGVQLASCALSEESGQEIRFYEMETGSSFMPERSDVPRTERVLTTRTLDEVVADALPQMSNLFLKIDVQGAELKVLRGGGSTLKRCGAVQLECAMLQYNSGAPLLPEVVDYMANQGFFPIEVSGFSRPRAHLVQVDLVFAPKDSPLRPDSFQFA